MNDEIEEEAQRLATELFATLKKILSSVANTKVTVADLRPMFWASSLCVVQDRGLLAVTELDRDSDDFSHLIDKEVIINGNLYHCLGVDRFEYCPPYTKGQRIGLIVTKEAKNAIQRFKGCKNQSQ